MIPSLTLVIMISQDLPIKALNVKLASVRLSLYVTSCSPVKCKLVGFRCVSLLTRRDLHTDEVFPLP